LAILGGICLAMACGPKGDRTLGEACDVDGDCEEGMFCGDDGSTAGQCTRDCEPTPDPCPELFGDAAFCNVAGLCAVECDSDEACPRGTVCTNDTCDRP
ncbi:MAG: hypothetical protein AAF721_02410, partial [Myxococcota bacterium]